MSYRKIILKLSIVQANTKVVEEKKEGTTDNIFSERPAF